MKYCAVKIQNSENSILILRMLMPETRTKIADTLNRIIPRNLDTMVHLLLENEVCVQPYMFQNAERKSFDWVSVNAFNKIIKIDKKASPNRYIDLHPDATCIITLRPGFCDKNNIHPINPILQ